MSQLQIFNLKLQNETKSTIQKSILKNPQQCSNQSKIRLDWAGNQIIKGGLHKIVFLNQIDTARTFIDLLSNDITDSLIEDVHQEQKNFNQIQANNTIKNQCEQSQQSNCCFIQ
ncbi:unnamed protein product [Paramecium sonneborni]|uniref:Uncharacterized protein n=1 Tax=Paramecium sonneborni TaxID=65129 RepID=A0A8S1MJG3_9CILI|nr:unnamed protein product [Paramecium sonneborni]